MFARHVALDGDVLVCGAPVSQGSAFVFQRDAGRWSQSQVLVASDAHPVNAFGAAVAIDGRWIAACPCGNEDTGERGCRNGTGRGAGLDASGSNSASADDLVLVVHHMPAAMPGFFVIATDPAAGGLGVPAYDGLACVGGTLLRGPIFVTDAGGVATLAGPLGAIVGANGLVEPGRTLYYQAFYRDALTSVCGTTANLSSAFAVTYAP